MEFLNVGPLELFFFLLIAFIVLGPDEAIKAGKKIGQFLSRLFSSETWRSMVNASREIRNLPRNMVSESGVEETMMDISREMGRILDNLNTPTNKPPHNPIAPNERPVNLGNTGDPFIPGQKKQ